MAAKKPRLKVSPIVLARVRQRIANRQPYDLMPQGMFTPAKHPPGIAPTKLAMDQDVDALGSSAWAWDTVQSLTREGLFFLGYPLLSEMAQRPEFRRISEITAMEMTRKWIRFEASGEEDKSDKIKKIEAEFKRLKAKSIFRKAAELDGFFGRGHIFIDVGTSQDELKTPLGDGGTDFTRAKLKKIKRLKAVEPVWTYPTSYNSDNPLAENWYRPDSWFVMGTQIHTSRLLTFIGREVPDMLKPAYSFGGLSLSQMAKPYVDNWLRTRQSVADIIRAFSIFVLKTRMSTLLTEGGDELFDRAELFNLLRDNRSLMMIDKDSEEFQNVSAPLGSLDQLQAQTQEHMAAVSGIPLVKLLGIQPAGLNADSEGIMRSFYDWIESCQEKLFTDNIQRLLNLVQITLFGEVDPEISFAYQPLWSMDKKAMAEMWKTMADTDLELIEAGIISPQESRTRWAHDPETPYPGLDIFNLPDVEKEDIGDPDLEDQDAKPPARKVKQLEVA